MKLSILTATYNRGKFLRRLYDSIVNNLVENMDVEWLIMDDGSNDETQKIVSSFNNIDRLEIKFFRQENQGKMQAINNLMKYVKGELIIECDSDDFFVENALKIIYKKYKILQDNPKIYAMVFLKNEYKEKLSGNLFPTENKETTMFDLYFKDDIKGEKVLVYNAEIRKKYRYIIEDGEKFCTEARLHHNMDLDYKVICYNDILIEGEYQKDGYTKNINKIFYNNPKGYYYYFKEILEKNMKGVKFKKRIYVIKHYILFSTICNKRLYINQMTNITNKIITIILFIPGYLKSILYKKQGE